MLDGSQASQYSTAGLTLLLLQLMNAEEQNDEDEEDYLFLLGAVLLIFGHLSELSNASNDGDDESGRLGSTRGNYNVQKSEDTLGVMFEHDRWHRQFFRCSHKSFSYLCTLLGADPEFRSTGKKPKKPIQVQLAAFFRRYGRTNGHHIDNARECNIGAGSVFNYCKNVVTALRRLRNHFVQYPSGERRDEVCEAFGELGFPGACGAADGMLIQLVQVPAVNGIYYYCRKKYYGINVLAVVDHEGRFTYYDIGWPASQTDITIFSKTRLWLERKDFLDDGEYLLVDKGFKITPYTIRSFDDMDLRDRNERPRRVAFNKRHAKARSVVEHAFGQLKGRFPALKFMAGRDMVFLYRSVEALMILHNILIDLNDSVKDIDGFDGFDADANELEDLLNNGPYNADNNAGGGAGGNVMNDLIALKEAGRALREGILDTMGL